MCVCVKLQERQKLLQREKYISPELKQKTIDDLRLKEENFNNLRLKEEN